jgi:carbonic anhydrase
MDPLLDGVRRFQTRIFPKRRWLFERLARGQSPLALFITCADSRIVPELITQTHPGELFTERNPGALVPVYTRQLGGVSASIEYAVCVLNVPRIIVCTHSDCGAMRGILKPETVAALPAVSHWLENGKRLEDETSPEELARTNLPFQLRNLMTHPEVEQGVNAGKLTIEGWYYGIETGEVTVYPFEPAPAGAGK